MTLDINNYKDLLGLIPLTRGAGALPGNTALS